MGSVMIKTKPKTFKAGDIIQLDIILEHPMEIGLRKDKDGKIVPLHHIKDLTVTYGGKVVTTLDMTASVSANPYISINLKISDGEKPLKVKATDNKGEISEKEIVIKPS